MDEVDMCNPDMYGKCRCPVPVNTGPIIINQYYTYYPKAGMLRFFDRVFHTVRSPAGNEWPVWGLHFFKNWMQIKDRESICITVWCQGGPHAWANIWTKRDMSKMEHRDALHLQDVVPGFRLLYLVRKIQTWVRRALKTRRQTRRLAFAMGMHARLGCQSMVMGLHADTLQLIL